MEGPTATWGMEAELGGEPKAPGSQCLLPSSAQLPVGNKPLQWVQVGQRQGRAPCAHPTTQVSPWSSTLGHPKSFVMHGQESSVLSQIHGTVHVPNAARLFTALRYSQVS